MDSWHDPIQPRPTRNRSSKRWLVRILVVGLLVAGAFFVGSVFGSADPGNDPYTGPLEREIGMVRSAWHVAISEIGEDPALVPLVPEDPLPICAGATEARINALTKGLSLMRATDNGESLYQLLVSEGVCIEVANIPYNSAYASLRWSPARGWSESVISVDDRFVTALYPDVLAAILVHEATHLERAVDRTACYYVDACTTLENGVELEEEIVAHAAEVEWWIEAYGNNGKDFAFGSDHALNELKSAYLRGSGDFRDLVLQSRSDPREGEGI